MDNRKRVIIHIKNPNLEGFGLCGRPRQKIDKNSKDPFNEYAFIYCGLCMQKEMEDLLKQLIEEAKNT